MWKYIKYLAISLAILTSCQKLALSPETDGTFSDAGLISFSTRIKTKAPIITSLNGKDFGVYGYKFSPLTNWNTVKLESTPNVFSQLKVSSDQNGACSYSVNTQTAINGREQWILDQRYAFFAYYPYSASSISLSSNTTRSTPYISYTLPISGGSADPDNLIDIMTAEVVDYRANQGTVVKFEFDHRLFCIELYAQNFNTESVKITDLSMNISGIHYNKAQIFMDKYVETIPSSTLTTGTHSARFPIFTNSMTLESEDGLTSISGTKNIVLIPQDSSKSGATGLTIEVKFKKDNSNDYITRSSTYYVNFQEGLKYSLTVNFIGDDVVLVNAAPKAWDSKDVTHTFE